MKMNFNINNSNILVETKECNLSHIVDKNGNIYFVTENKINKIPIGSNNIIFKEINNINISIFLNNDSTSLYGITDDTLLEFNCNNLDIIKKIRLPYSGIKPIIKIMVNSFNEVFILSENKLFKYQGNNKFIDLDIENVIDFTISKNGDILLPMNSDISYYDNNLIFKSKSVLNIKHIKSIMIDIFDDIIILEQNDNYYKLLKVHIYENKICYSYKFPVDITVDYLSLIPLNNSYFFYVSNGTNGSGYIMNNKLIKKHSLPFSRLTKFVEVGLNKCNITQDPYCGSWNISCNQTIGVNIV